MGIAEQQYVTRVILAILFKDGKAQGKTDHNTAYRNYNRKTGKGVLSLKNSFWNSML